MVGTQGNIGLGLSGKTLASGSQARFWRQGPQPAGRTRPDGLGSSGFLVDDVGLRGTIRRPCVSPMTAPWRMRPLRPECVFP